VAGFGTFTFAYDEGVIAGTDSGWVPAPNVRRAANLGSIRDSILVMARGSMTRSFTVYLTPARLAALQLLQNSVANFTDWFSTPVVQSAFLQTAAPSSVALPGLGQVGEKVQVRVSLISQ
jgi:hypothetical protein